jgi:hypothetical protein
MTTITNLIATNEIHIVSGEGEIGTTEIYNGKRTMRAINMRLTKERSSGARWAKAKVSIGNGSFIDLKTLEYC